jgi:hypothetical protein
VPYPPQRERGTGSALPAGGPRAAATTNTNGKDAVEATVHAAVCDRRVGLADAQRVIATDWVTALADLGLR